MSAERCLVASAVPLVAASVAKEQKLTMQCTLSESEPCEEHGMWISWEEGQQPLMPEGSQLGIPQCGREACLDEVSVAALLRMFLRESARE